MLAHLIYIITTTIVAIVVWEYRFAVLNAWRSSETRARIVERLENIRGGK